MKNLFLLHHLGMGDHIICNGLVRTLCERYDYLIFPVKPHNLNNIKTMFADLENINFISVNDDFDMLKHANKYRNIFQILHLGCFEKSNFINANETFCQSFYRQANVPYNFRWSKFKIIRNEEKENALYNNKNDKFIFVHDDASRNMVINQSYIDGNIYRPQHNLGKNTDVTIFDYIKILEASSQIHCMDSSFAALVDHLPQLNDKTKYIHRYIRKNSLNPQYKNNWSIIQ